jgi:hypothetical protein
VIPFVRPPPPGNATVTLAGSSDQEHVLMSESSAWLWIRRPWRDSEDWRGPVTKSRQTRTPTRGPRTPLSRSVGLAKSPEQTRADVAEPVEQRFRKVPRSTQPAITKNQTKRRIDVRQAPNPSPRTPVHLLCVRARSRLAFFWLSQLAAKTDFQNERTPDSKQSSRSEGREIR